MSNARHKKIVDLAVCSIMLILHPYIHIELQPNAKYAMFEARREVGKLMVSLTLVGLLVWPW